MADLVSRRLGASGRHTGRCRPRRCDNGRRDDPAAIKVNLLRVSNVTRSFGNFTAVDGVSMSIDSGEVVGLVGANGAGKTTLIRMILGLLAMSAGEINVLGKEPAKVDRSEIGYVPQGLGLYSDLTVAENLEFSAKAFGVPPVDLDPDLAEVANQAVASISLGLRRRLAFANTLSHKPKLLMLDEPTSGVGPVGRVGLWEQIRSEADAGSGVLVSTHYMEEAEQCDRVLMMSTARIVASGTVEEIIGSRTTVVVRGVDSEQMASAKLVIIPDGNGWRVPGHSADELRGIFGDISVEEKPMEFEEAFIGLSS